MNLKKQIVEYMKDENEFRLITREYLNDISYHQAIVKKFYSSKNCNEFYDVFEDDLNEWVLEATKNNGESITEFLNITEKDLLLRNHMFKSYIIYTYCEYLADELLKTL